MGGCHEGGRWWKKDSGNGIHRRSSNTSFCPRSSTPFDSARTDIDIHLKQNIQKIGMHENGLGIYIWKWNEEARRKGINDPNIGFIAQEAQVLYPQHVSMDPSGYLKLDYDVLNR